MYKYNVLGKKKVSSLLFWRIENSMIENKKHTYTYSMSCFSAITWLIGIVY